MRWVIGARVDIPGRVPPIEEVPAEEPKLKDAEPEAFWDPEARELSVTPRPYDPEAEVAPIQAAVMVLAEGSGLLSAGADELIASAEPRTVTPLSTDPAGGPPTPLPLPGYDDSINNAVVLLYGYRV